MRLSYNDAVPRYGEITDGVWADEGKWMELIIPPDGLTWTNGCVDGNPPVEHIYVNSDMSEPLLHALQNIVDRNLVDQLKTFDGCFYIRQVRGCDTLSCHAYGLAIDINAADEQMGTPGHLSPELVACFTDEGFTWGGNFSGRKDPMHFSYGWE